MWLTQLFYPWGFLLQALALIHFFRRRPESYWLYIIFFFGALGAIIYFFAEVLPDAGLLRDSFHRAGRKRRLAELDAIVKENAAVGNVEELADLCLEQSQYARAKELYDQVLASRQVNSLDPYYRRGIAELELGDAAAATADIARVVADQPKYDFSRAIGLLAHAYAQSGQADKAEECFKQATDLSTLSETYYNYAQFLSSQRRNAEAIEWLDRILAKKATMPRFARRQERPWFRKAIGLKKGLGR